MKNQYKVAIKVGHTKKAKGAYSPTLGESEYDYNLAVAQKLVELGNCGKIKYEMFIFDANISSYTKRQELVAKEINSDEEGFDLVIELHYNSAESHTARGVLVLYYYKSSKGKEAAKVIGDSIFNVFQTERDPDVGLSSDKQNGYQAVVTPKPVAILLEPFFGSNPQESALFKGDEGKTKYALSIHMGVMNYFKI